ncbi:hypothetical protein PC110_g21982 [Phytophthora cactorum]|uniref:Uncharacterized protein n=1 Tax=Phytophthora cactorum TaxID=29920 RepID=A0A329RA96_9STRA|nr:hypothetical protein PC110_g21982 [Phytophthora cactorum]
MTPSCPSASFCSNAQPIAQSEASQTTLNGFVSSTAGPWGLVAGHGLHPRGPVDAGSIPVTRQRTIGSRRSTPPLVLPATSIPMTAMVDKVQGTGHNFNSNKHRVGDRDTDALLQSLHTRGAPDVDERRDSGAIAAPDSPLKPPPPPRLLFIRLMVAVYLLQMGMFLFARQDPRSKIRRSLLLVATVLLGCCWAACVVLLPAYGERMCVLLDKVAEDVTHRKRNIRRIAVIAAVFCLMHTASSMLLAASQCTPPSDEASSSIVGNTTHPSDIHWPHIPLQHVVQANPAFFFPSGTAEDGAANSNDGLLRWVVMIEVLEFPIEWAMLMALLCVLPTRSALPAFRGYRPIPERKNWQP